MPTRTAEIPVALPADEADCGSCADRLRDELGRHRGLMSVEPVGASVIRVSYDPDLCSISCVTRAADAIGVNLGRRFHHEVVAVEGMDCYDCAQTIERAVGRLPGVTSCSVSFAGARMRVEYEADGGITPDALRKTVASLGYRIPAAVPPGAEPPARQSFFVRNRREIVTAGAALLTLAALTLSAGGAEAAAVPLYVVAIAAAGWPVARAGIAAARLTRRPDINLLMTIAVIGAGAIGAWLEAALVVVLFSIGEDLEGYAVDRARRSLAGLVELSPQTARVRRGDREVEIGLAELAVADVVVIRPGERIPADGRVTDGASAVDQAAITGESVPVDKERGDEVFAGTLNGEGRLVVEVGRAPGDTTLDRIAKAVAEAQAQKATTERWVDAFAKVYTPIVMGVAVLTVLVPSALGVGSFSQWFYRGLAFLILACPCALVIATPVSIVSALARASAAGVLVKGGAYLETAAGINAVAFDKTGTLTAGRPRVTKIVALASRTDAQVLRLAASLEAASEHPLARAVVAEAASWNVQLAPVEDFVALRGYGVEGTVAGFRFRVGKPSLFAGHPGVADAQATIDRLEREGRTVVVVGDDERIAGLLGINDTVRPGARGALDTLRRAGVEVTMLLTGDHQAAGDAVAREAGIDRVHAALLPDDKVRLVEDLGRGHDTVAMVGDGVNDAPALARAAVGIAMGSAGSPTAIETADVALMGEDVGKVAGLIGLARWSRAVVRQNIVFSLAVKGVAAALALAGVLTLWMAVLADVGATLLVVANGLRLLRSRPHGRLRELPMLEAKG
ncbi:MAG: heavy metal translocating P-type ATPase [Actinomycetota bacterium]